MQKIQSAPDRRWAKDVAPGDEIRALYLIGSASQLQAKNGPFWRLELKDASGDFEARIWSPLSQQFAEIPSGVIAEVEGRAESFRDKLQVNVNALRVLSPEETASVDTSVFMASSGSKTAGSSSYSTRISSRARFAVSSVSAATAATSSPT